MKVLVTGCAGFIGSHVCEALVERGADVTGVDAFTPFYDVELKRRNCAGFHGRAQVYGLDLREANLDILLDSMDVVLHIAGQPGVRSCWGPDFAEYVSCNILATQRLLDAMARTRWRGRLVFTSTSSVYGKQLIGFMHEADPCEPLSPYGVTKFAAEQLIHCYREAYGLDAVILRLFSVYGPRQRPDMAVSRFIDAIHNGREVHIYGDGSQVREMTYVGDVVSAILAAARLGRTGGVPVYNVGGGTVVTVLGLAEYIARIMDKELSIVYKSTMIGEVVSNAADTSRIQADLGWRPTVGLEAGLARQMRWACTESR